MKFEGTTTDNFHIKSSVESQSVDCDLFSSYLVFDIKHFEVKKIGNYEAKQVRFGLTNLNLEKFNEGLKLDLELEDHSSIESNIAAVVKGDSHDEMIKFLKIFHSIDVTSEITLKIEKDEKLQQMEEVTDNLCYLLSLARGTKIQWIYYNIYNEGTI